jgi:acyl CoA:acetate/3-ketoacid CoA transferase alpha subunit
MTKRALTAIDNRPFFEKVLSHGHKIGVIPKAKVDEILESGPRGIFQIAEKFGTPYMQPHLLSAKHRIVNLVSLYLENASK